MLEPVVLGVAVAPSPASLLVGCAATAGFLAHRPWKLWRGDRRRGRSYPRTVLARRFALTLGSLAVGSLVGALALGGVSLLLPLILAAPAAGAYLWYDRRPGRSWQAELAAPAAVASVSGSAALASGWGVAPGLALWGLAAARSLPAVLYVRERLRLQRTGEARRALVWAAHLVALIAITGLVGAELAPLTATMPFVLLLARSVAGLAGRRSRTPKAVGIAEIVWGAVTVLAIVAAYELTGS